MTEIQQFKKYKARIKYHRTDDLQPDALPDGLELIVRAMWMAEPDEKFAGEWIFEPVERGYWLPERDLEIMHEVWASIMPSGYSEGWKNNDFVQGGKFEPNDISPTARVISREENDENKKAPA